MYWNSLHLPQTWTNIILSAKDLYSRFYQNIAILFLFVFIAISSVNVNLSQFRLTFLLLLRWKFSPPKNFSISRSFHFHCMLHTLLNNHMNKFNFLRIYHFDKSFWNLNFLIYGQKTTLYQEVKYSINREKLRF